MKINFLVSVFVFLFTNYAFSQDLSFKTSFKKVPLKEFTNISLNILPDSGVQLIFPFALDDPGLSPTFKINLSNKKGFSVPATNNQGGSDALLNQNSITIVGNPTEEIQLGTLFINIGGYNISIALHTVFDVRKVSSSIIFEVGDEKRNHLINLAVDRYKVSIKKKHDDAMSKIDDSAKKHALGYVGTVAISEPESMSFKFEEVLSMGEARLVFYADELILYDDFSVLVFELDNPNNKDLRVDSVSLSAVGENDVSYHVDGVLKCPDSIPRGEVVKCTFSTTSNFLKDAVEIDLSISTDFGSAEVKW